MDKSQTAALIVAACRFLERDPVTNEDKLLTAMIKTTISRELYFDALDIVKELMDTLVTDYTPSGQELKDILGVHTVN